MMREQKREFDLMLDLVCPMAGVLIAAWLLLAAVEVFGW